MQFLMSFQCKHKAVQSPLEIVLRHQFRVSTASEKGAMHPIMRIVALRFVLRFRGQSSQVFDGSRQWRPQGTWTNRSKQKLLEASATSCAHGMNMFNSSQISECGVLLAMISAVSQGLATILKDEINLRVVQNLVFNFHTLTRIIQFSFGAAPLKKKKKNMFFLRF